MSNADATNALSAYRTLQRGKGDESLPLDRETVEELDPDLWWPMFNDLQYEFLARPFRVETESLHLSEEYVLPIIEKEYLSKEGFSRVYKIKVHPKYDCLNNYDGGQEFHWYALKQLQSSEESERPTKYSIKVWQDEVAANALVRKQQHPNILPLLHSHTYGSYCNLIFPLASYNLKEFYSKEPHPSSPELRLRFIEQISRLVPALGAIHRGETDSVNRRIGYHRDLKPDNILVFEKSMQFVISGLGRMKFREVRSEDSEYSGVEWTYGISAYNAPECDVWGKKVGKGADIWSMGCILAEAITWCECGSQGIEDFKKARMSVHDDEIQDLFFTDERAQDGKEGAARLKAQVLEWFAKIKMRSDNSPLICDSLDVVESMLRGKPKGAKGRPTAEGVDCELYSILKREADRLGTHLVIKEPVYYTSFEWNTDFSQCQALPFSYSRSTSRIASPLKRQRSEFESFSGAIPDPTALRPRSIKRQCDISEFLHLKRLDTMFLVDDYISDVSAPWSKIRAAIANLAPIATAWDQDGVDLAFINSRRDFSCLGNTADVLSAFDRVGPSEERDCMLKLRLDVMLSDYILRFKNDRFTKPLNLIVVTSGDFVEADEFEETVMQWAKELDHIYAPKSQLGLQFVLVGCSHGNVRRFHQLGAKMHEVYQVRDMVDATCYDPSAPEDPKLLERIMCGGMIKTFDRMEEEDDSGGDF